MPSRGAVESLPCDKRCVAPSFVPSLWESSRRKARPCRPTLPPIRLPALPTSLGPAAERSIGFEAPHRSASGLASESGHGVAVRSSSCPLPWPIGRSVVRAIRTNTQPAQARSTTRDDAVAWESALQPSGPAFFPASWISGASDSPHKRRTDASCSNASAWVGTEGPERAPRFDCRFFWARRNGAPVGAHRVRLGCDSITRDFSDSCSASRASIFASQSSGPDILSLAWHLPRRIQASHVTDSTILGVGESSPRTRSRGLLGIAAVLTQPGSGRELVAGRAIGRARNSRTFTSAI